MKKLVLVAAVLACAFAAVAGEKLLTDNIYVKKPNGGVKKLGGQIAREANGFNCTSIFARDGLNKIFY